MMKRKFMVAALAVCMLAGFAQAADYIPPTFDITTSNFGDITIVGASLDGVGEDTTPEAYRNTVAADGAEDWASEIDAATQTGPQYYPHTTFRMNQLDPNVLDPIPFGLRGWDEQEPELITTVDVDEGWYRVFVVYTGTIFARLDDEREFLCFDANGRLAQSGQHTTAVPGDLVVDLWGNESEQVDWTDTRTTTWRPFVAPVGYVNGSQVTLRVGPFDRVGGLLRNESVHSPNGTYVEVAYLGIGYQPVSKEVVVIEEPNTVANEGGAGYSITVHLTDAPSANVEVTLTPDSDEYAVGGAAAGAPKVLTFTPGDWAAQTVAITAPDDADADNHNGLLAVTVSSPGGDADYDGDAVDSLEVTVVDDDMPAAIPGLVGWFKLDGDAKDSSGHGNHGMFMELLDTPLEWSFAPGMDGLALHTNYDGFPYIHVTPGDPNHYVPEGGITVSLWIFRCPASRWSWQPGWWSWLAAVGNYANWGESSWVMRMWGDHQTAWSARGAEGGETGYFWGPRSFSDNQWHHIVATYTPSTGFSYLYTDGLKGPRHPGGYLGDQMPPQALHPNLANNPLRIAQSNLPDYPTRNMWIDDIRIYDRPLSAEEIAQLHYDFTGKTICMQDIGPIDTNNDCIVNMEDLKEIMAIWLSCNLFPASECGL